MSCLKTASFSLRFESLKSPLEVHGPSTSTSESISQLNASEAALPSRCPQGEGRSTQPVTARWTIRSKAGQISLGGFAI